MNVLIACEFSGVVRDAFLRHGHNAISCDLLPTESPGPHYQGDIRDILYSANYDLMIAHPPCTDLAVSGARYFAEKIADGRQQRAIEFVKMLMEAPIPRIAIENPVGVISRYIRKPDQIVQPYYFGDSFSKKTCLWLKGLPLLKPTHIVDKGEQVTYASGRSMPKWYADAFKLPPIERAKLRSKTFPGFAEAMAEQWGIW